MHLSRIIFISPSLLKDSTAGYRIVGWSFLLCALWICYPIASNLNFWWDTGYLSFWGSFVSDELFFFGCFQDFLFVFLWLSAFSLCICLWISEFIVARYYWVSRMWSVDCFPKNLVSFSPSFLQIFFILSFLSFWNSYYTSVGTLMSCISLRLSSLSLIFFPVLYLVYSLLTSL